MNFKCSKLQKFKLKKFGRLSQYTPQDGFQTLFFDLHIAAPGSLSASAVDAAGEGGVGGKRPSSASTRIDVQPPMIRRTKEEARLSGGACVLKKRRRLSISLSIHHRQDRLPPPEEPGRHRLPECFSYLFSRQGVPARFALLVQRVEGEHVRRERSVPAEQPFGLVAVLLVKRLQIFKNLPQLA